MANNNDFKVILEAMIDNSSLTNVQKQLAKERLKINADISVEDFAKSKQEIEKQIGKLAKNIKNILGTAITDKQASQWAKQYYDGMVSGAKEAAKAQEKLNAEQRKNTLAEQEKYYKRIIENNKEIYALKEKKLSADKEESKELQRQITNLEKRNKRAYDSISQKGLGDTQWGLEVSNSEKELKNRLAIKEARLQDKANAQEQVNVEKQIAEYNKQELEYQKQRKQYEAEGIKQAQDEELLRQSMEYYEQEKYYQETRAKYLAEGKAQEEAYNAEVKETTEYYKQMAKEADKAYESRQRLAEANAKKVDEIQLLSNGGIKNDYATQIAKLEGDFRSLGLAQDTITTKTQNVKNSLATLRAEFAKPVDQQNFQAIQTANDNLQRELIESRNEFEQLRASMKGMATEQQRLSLANAIEAWNQKNTAATKAVREENERYVISLRDLSNQMTRMDFNKINTGFKQNENSMRALNRLGASLKDQFTQAYRSFTMWLSASTMVMALISKIRKIPGEVIKVNSAMIELTKVSSASENELKNYFDEAAKSAKDLGATISDVISATADFSRLGYNLPDASELAKVATLYKNVGDGIDIDQSSSSIVSTMKAFKIEASDAIGIVDKFNEVDILAS